jgi:hypothetical protein
LEDCWFLASVIVVALIPNAIKKLFMRTTFHPMGCLSVYLFINGCFEEILIDDFVTKSYANSTKKELWIQILEKAMAKHLGGYHKFREWACD